MCMGKNNNRLVYSRLINVTVLYLLTTVLLYSTVDIYGRYSMFLFLILAHKIQ